jgi:hypothetical protein
MNRSIDLSLIYAIPQLDFHDFGRHFQMPNETGYVHHTGLGVYKTMGNAYLHKVTV